MLAQHDDRHSWLLPSTSRNEHFTREPEKDKRPLLKANLPWQQMENDGYFHWGPAIKVVGGADRDMHYDSWYMFIPLRIRYTDIQSYVSEPRSTAQTPLPLHLSQRTQGNGEKEKWKSLLWSTWVGPVHAIIRPSGCNAAATFAPPSLAYGTRYGWAIIRIIQILRP